MAMTRTAIARWRARMRLTSLLAVAISLSAPLAACATDAGDADTAEVTVDEDDGKADAASEISVRAGDTTLTVGKLLTWQNNAFVMRAKASRTFEEDGVREYIIDDVYGDVAIKSARVFEVRWPVSEARMVVDGTNLFTSLSFVHSSSRPDHLTLRVTARPRLGATHGSSTLALTAELTPVVQAGHTVYRVNGRSTKAIASLRATTGTVRIVDPTHFELDLDYDQLQSVVGGGEIAVTAAFTTGTATSTILAPLGLAVKKLSLTTGDAYALYPNPTCTAPRKSCLAALPDGALDTASCGEAIDVLACRGALGALINDATINDAKTAFEPKLVTLAADGVGLVGADKAVELAATVREVVNGRLAAEGGAWLLTAAARTKVLATATDVPLDEAYALPLYFVDGHEAAPGDVAATRQVAADALLSYLRTTDYEHSELGRSYLTLTKELRAQHVASLKAFRETSERVTFPSMPNVESFVGEWIGLHTEVTVDHTTGEVTGVLVEID